MTDPTSPLPPSAAGQGLARSGVALAVATAISGLLGYVYILVLTRALGPERFGILGALTGLSVILSVASTAIQLEATRSVAGDPVAARDWLYARGRIVSAATGVLALAISPAVVAGLRLDSWWPAIALAAVMIPQTYLGVQLGILLGSGRPAAFGVLLVVSALSRTLAAILTAVLHRGPAFALWATAATALAVLGVGHLLLRADRRAFPAATTGPAGPDRDTAHPDSVAHPSANPGAAIPGRPSHDTRWAGTLRAAVAAGALLVLLDADLLVARAVLSEHDAGWYAFLTVFGRVTFWGTNFIALWVLPHEAARGSAATARAYALGAVAVMGLAAVGAAAVAGGWLTSVLAGPAYAGAAAYAPLFAVAGSLLSVVQLAIYVDVARARHVLGSVVWAASVVLVLAIRFVAPRTIGGVIWCTVLVLAAVAAVGLARMREPHHAAPTHPSP